MEQMRIEHGPAGLHVEASAYRLALPAGSAFARLSDTDGAAWADLLLDATLDARAGLDETVARQDPRIVTDASTWSAVVPLVSSLWRRKEVRLEGDDTTIRFSAAVEGEGHLADVHLLGGWSSATPAAGTGFGRSGAAFLTLLSPEPADPARLTRPASEPASLDVLGGGGPGTGHWFFTPPPFCFAVSRERPAREGGITDGSWLGIGVSAATSALDFCSIDYLPAERSFTIRLPYEGQTRFVGRFETPDIVLLPGRPDPYSALRAWADDLRARGFAPAVRAAPPPRWWLEPIFCGWGAQAALAVPAGQPWADRSTQVDYDRFLATLAEHGLAPGTVVVDDRWQAAYGSGEPDTARWPDLRGWIRARHDEGRRVLLWWKAWDPGGVPDELCVRSAAGVPVAVDPSNGAYETFLRAVVRRLLGVDGLGADGLKVDFTARTPSGPGLRRDGPGWGAALLHRLLWILHDEAHRVRSDALVITHAPHPGFIDVTDMVRLNDMLRLAEPDDPSAVVEQMRHRARIVGAVCPGVPIDTDDWAAPDLATWRAYLERKADLGVPSLYYVDTIDQTGERLEERDYAALREAWSRWRSAIDGREPASSTGTAT
jgi:hypothetical protein